MKTIRQLFDFKFESYLAPRLIRLVYAILTVIFTVAVVIFSVAAADASNGTSILVGPIVGLVYLAIFRILYESALVKFQMAEDIRRLPQMGEAGNSMNPWSPPSSPD